METKQFDVIEYLSPIGDNSKRLSVIEKELKGLEKLTLPSERFIRNNFQNELIKEKVSLMYPKIDLSFLEIGQDKEFFHSYEKGFWNPKKLTEKVIFSVPKFGIYQINNNTFSMNIKNSVSDNDGMLGIIGSIFGGMIGMAFGSLSSLIPSATEPMNILGGALSGAIIGGTFLNYYLKTPLEKIIEFSTTPGIFNKHLMKSFDFSKFLKINYGGENYPFYEKGIPKELNEKYKKLGNTTLSSNFNCSVPQETKEKIKEAKTMFGNEIYFIKEMKPEEWNVEKTVIVEEDPIVVGINNSHCYYVDSFDPTPLEAYFSGKKLREN